MTYEEEIDRAILLQDGLDMDAIKILRIFSADLSHKSSAVSQLTYILRLTFCAMFYAGYPDR